MIIATPLTACQALLTPAIERMVRGRFKMTACNFDRQGNIQHIVSVNASDIEAALEAIRSYAPEGMVERDLQWLTEDLSFEERILAAATHGMIKRLHNTLRSGEIHGDKDLAWYIAPLVDDAVGKMPIRGT
jgi:hypothetical protein